MGFAIFNVGKDILHWVLQPSKDHSGDCGFGTTSLGIETGKTKFQGEHLLQAPGAFATNQMSNQYKTTKQIF